MEGELAISSISVKDGRWRTAETLGTVNAKAATSKSTFSSRAKDCQYAENAGLILQTRIGAD